VIGDEFYTAARTHKQKRCLERFVDPDAAGDRRRAPGRGTVVGNGVGEVATDIQVRSRTSTKSTTVS
jgi:hypothetical protein